jgi:hypothetical protein
MPRGTPKSGINSRGAKPFVPPTNFLFEERVYKKGVPRYEVICECTACTGAYRTSRQAATKRKTTLCRQCELTQKATPEQRTQKLLNRINSNWSEQEERPLYEVANGCWLWLGAIHPENGYGAMWDGEKLGRAHRVIYEAVNNMVPEGMDLDHLCRVRHCVNPDHLEPVTRSENLQRGHLARKGDTLLGETNA